MSDPLYNLNGKIVSLDDMKAREAAYWEKWRATRPDLDKTALSPVALKKLELLKREYAYRQIQALKLYEPLPIQKQFHECRSPERIIIGGNRGTKTMCCAAEIAMAVTGTHRYGGKYPKEGGLVICVAKDGIKIGEVFYAKLFMPGAFSMVKDPETGIYRAWRPWTDGWDIPRRKALPLIPKRMISAIAWEDKKLNQPKKVTLTTGWAILFFTSAGKPIEGIAADACWFDEEIYEKSTLGSWYDEMAARLIDREGMFIWSATPQGATQQLSDLNDRAEEEKNDPEPRITAFHVTLDDNPFLPEKAKDLFRHKASFDPDEYRVRVLGEFLLSSQLVYPNFRKSTHCVEPFAVPPNWCRYLVVDPGFANVVGLFFAIPPPTADPQIRDHVYVYDEVYGHQWDAKKFVERLYPKMHGQVFQSFIIDRHGSIRTESSGMTVGEQYAEQMRVRGLRSIETGSDFHAIGDSGSQASSPVKMGVSQVRSWLWERDEFGGTAKLQVFAHCEEFIREMSKYRNKIDKGKATDIPDNKRFSHGPDALRYAVLHGLAYVQPGKPKKRLKGLVKYLRNIAKAERKQDGNFVLLGPTYSRR